MNSASTTSRFERIYRELIIADIKNQLRPIFVPNRVSDSDAAYALSVASRLALVSDGTTDEGASVARKAYEVAIRTLGLGNGFASQFREATDLILSRLGNFPARELLRSRTEQPENNRSATLKLEMLASARHAKGQQFYGSTISWDSSININNGGWALKFKDGTVWGFPDSYYATTGAQGSLVFIQDRFGNKVAINRQLGSQYQNGGTGNINQIISPNGRWLQFTYDGCNRVQQISDNMGRSTYYTYDTNPCTSGHLIKVQDLNGNTTTYAYEGATIDQMTSITDGRQVTYLQNTYDSNNRVYQQTLANQGTYTFNYNTDTNGNITQTTITDPNGIQRQMSFSTPEIFESGFQTGGYLTSQTFALGRPEQQTYRYSLGTPANNPGNFLQAITDLMGRTTYYTYDALGNVTSITRLFGTSTPSTATLTYEPTFSRVTSFTDP